MSIYTELMKLSEKATQSGRLELAKYLKGQAQVALEKEETENCRKAA